MSLWIYQSEDVPCQRVRKRDKPARQEEQKKNRVNVYRKTGIEENLLYLKWRNFLSDNEVFIEEIQKVTD